MVSIPFLIFVAVSLGIGACYLVVADLLFGDFTLVRQRLDAEFRKKAQDEAPRSPLFKNLDPANFDAAPPPVAYDLGRVEDTVSATAPSVASPGMRARLEMLLEQ